MAIYATFFLCEVEQLQNGFPGWKLPLPDPVVRKVMNPFTREGRTITTCDLATADPPWLPRAVNGF